MCGGGEGVTTTGPDDIGSGGQDCAWVKAAHGSSLYMLQGCTEVTDVQGSRLCPWSRLCTGQGCAVISPSSVQLTDLYTWP